MLAIVVIFIRPREPITESDPEATEMSATKKADRDHDVDRDSQTTAV